MVSILCLERDTMSEVRQYAFSPEDCKHDGEFSTKIIEKDSKQEFTCSLCGFAISLSEAELVSHPNLILYVRERITKIFDVRRKLEESKNKSIIW